MSSKNSVVSLTLTLKGNAGQELRKIGVDQINLTKKVNEQLNLGTTATGKMVQIGTRVTATLKEQVNQSSLLTKQLDSSQRNGQLLERFMTQSAVQSKQLQAAVAKLGLDRPVRQTQEISENLKRAQMFAKGIAIAGAAVVGGVAAMTRPVRDTIQYEKDLAQLSITAYDKPSDRKQGQQTMQAMIKDSAKKYGQTTDDSLTGLNALVASGRYSDKNGDKTKTEANLRRALGASAEAAQASGGNIVDFASMSVQALGKGLQEKQFMGMAVQAGKEGSFETRDLAKYIPTQYGMMAADPANKIRQAGQLVALNQVAMTTAGGTDQAGNNVVNLLSKMNADSTKKTFKKDYGIDLDKEYLKGASNGKTQFDVFGEALKKAMYQDPAYKKVLKQIDAVPSKGVGDSIAAAQKSQILESQRGILEKSALSNILPDMQAGAAGVALVTQKNEMERITQAVIQKGQTSLTEDAGTMRDTAGYGTNALDVTRKNAEFDAMRGFTTSLGDVSLKISNYADKYPALTTAVGGATVALTALAGAGALAAGTSILTGGGLKGGAKIAGGLIGGAGGLLARGAAVVGGSSAVVAGAAGAAGYGAGSLARWGYTKTKIGQDADNALGGSLALFASYFSNEAKDALAQDEKYSTMISQQAEQLVELKQLNAHLSKMPSISLDGRLVSEHVGSHTDKQARRGARSGAGGTW